MNSAILITGATGGLGRRLARCYVEHSRRPLVLHVHAADETELVSRGRALLRDLDASEARVQIIGGDIAAGAPFASVDPESIGGIVHCAAVTRFNVERELARRVNVEGSQRVFEFAESCPKLEGLAYMSTVYAAGLATGTVAEEPLAEATAFANHYEWSKWRAESVLIEKHADLPWRIFRSATVIAEDDSGVVEHRNAFHNTLGLLYYGLLSLVPGERDVPLYFVTAQAVADAIFHSMESGAAAEREVFHLCPSREHSVSLGRLVDLAFERFAADPDFRRRGILPPLFCDLSTFGVLAAGVDSFGGSVVNEGMKSVLAFARQLFAPKNFLNTKPLARCSGARPEPTGALVERACDYLVRTRFQRQLTRPA